MVWVKLKPNASKTHDVQLPPHVKHRSILGDTLILPPGASCEMTAEEWVYIKDNLPEVVADVQSALDAAQSQPIDR